MLRITYFTPEDFGYLKQKHWNFNPEGLEKAFSEFQPLPSDTHNSSSRKIRLFLLDKIEEGLGICKDIQVKFGHQKTFDALQEELCQFQQQMERNSALAPTQSSLLEEKEVVNEILLELYSCVKDFSHEYYSMEGLLNSIDNEVQTYCKLRPENKPAPRLESYRKPSVVLSQNILDTLGLNLDLQIAENPELQKMSKSILSMLKETSLTCLGVLEKKKQGFLFKNQDLRLAREAFQELNKSIHFYQQYIDMQTANDYLKKIQIKLREHASSFKDSKEITGINFILQQSLPKAINIYQGLLSKPPMDMTKQLSTFENLCEEVEKVIYTKESPRDSFFSLLQGGIIELSQEDQALIVLAKKEIEKKIPTKSNKSSMQVANLNEARIYKVNEEVYESAFKAHGLTAYAAAHMDFFSGNIYISESYFDLQTIKHELVHFRYGQDYIAMQEHGNDDVSIEFLKGGALIDQSQGAAINEMLASYKSTDDSYKMPKALIARLLLKSALNELKQTQGINSITPASLITHSLTYIEKLEVFAAGKRSDLEAFIEEAFPFSSMEDKRELKDLPLTSENTYKSIDSSYYNALVLDYNVDASQPLKQDSLDEIQRQFKYQERPRSYRPHTCDKNFNLINQENLENFLQKNNTADSNPDFKEALNSLNSLAEQQFKDRGKIKAICLKKEDYDSYLLSNAILPGISCLDRAIYDPSFDLIIVNENHQNQQLEGLLEGLKQRDGSNVLRNTPHSSSEITYKAQIINLTAECIAEEIKASLGSEEKQQTLVERIKKLQELALSNEYINNKDFFRLSPYQIKQCLL